MKSDETHASPAHDGAGDIRPDSLRELAGFVGKATTPRKNRSGFWQAYRMAAAADRAHAPRNGVSDLLARVMVISARTRRLVSPRVEIELDVFSPDGNRAVHLIMGHYS